MPALADPTIAPDAVLDAAEELELEETTNGGVPELQPQVVEDEGAEAPADRIIGPIPPVLLRKQLVHGLYRSAAVGWQLELRVDVDGKRPMNRVSGDFFSVSGATTSYFGSFVLN